MLSSHRDPTGRALGVAPNADLVLVEALDSTGMGRPDDVVRGIEWVVANRDRYGIRVLALPLVARPGAPFWEDPVNLAVIDAWAAGIVVVVAAGNGGPAPVTVGAPGEVPQVITVGAADLGAAGVLVPSYSASGPSLVGFLKPEIVAPAGMAEAGAVPLLGDRVHKLPAGTAISSAVASGVVALVLEAHPWLTPDEVKRRLMSTARPVIDLVEQEHWRLRQGAGLIDAWAAVHSPTAAGVEDGPAEGGFVWSESAGQGLVWSDDAYGGMVGSDSALKGLLWSDWRTSVGMVWSD
jgi:hypothetical protein